MPKIYRVKLIGPEKEYIDRFLLSIDDCYIDDLGRIYVNFKLPNYKEVELRLTTDVEEPCDYHLYIIQDDFENEDVFNIKNIEKDNSSIAFNKSSLESKKYKDKISEAKGLGYNAYKISIWEGKGIDDLLESIKDTWVKKYMKPSSQK
jgi:hypothetical protein